MNAVTEAPKLTRDLLSHDWLTARVTKMVEDEDGIDPDENLIFYGLDSISVMRLVADLGHAGVKVAFEDMAREPSINGWWALIESRL